MGALIVVLAVAAWVGVCKAIGADDIAMYAGSIVIGWAVARLG
ncbi:hypothetical protein B551_0222675 [Cupriavidus sp. HPC(L)]|nr:hypothetical protein [Cupriavidus sp. HPC(L)]ESH90777.1 hypothetical protein B551_0222675 [Cupriavidus sp. HPC(L)]